MEICRVWMLRMVLTIYMRMVAIDAMNDRAFQINRCLFLDFALGS